MNTLRTILKPLASLRLTVILLALSMLLIFAGTLAQRSSGIETVKKQYFHTWGTWVEFQNLLPFVNAKVPGAFPMPGGWTLIGLLLANLLTAHALRFKVKFGDMLLLPLLGASLATLWLWQDNPSRLLLAAAIVVGAAFCAGLFLVHNKRAGVILLHLGLIFLLLGELVTSVFQVESQMTIEEGTYANYSQDIRSTELAFVDRSPSDHDNVVAVPGSMLREKGVVVADQNLPFQIEMNEWHRNSRLTSKLDELPKEAPTTTTRDGIRVGAVGIRPVAGVGDEASKVDAPSAHVTLRKGGQVLGRYLFSLHIDPQEITVDGKTYSVELRFRRHYKPFQLHLKDFSFKRFVGTETAKDYASVVRLVDPENGVDREVRIWMNHPLRYDGETYYQSSFTPDEKATILQVVRNPGWLMPYYSCAIVAVGMTAHFVMMLLTFVGRQTAVTPKVAGIARPGDPPALPPARNGKGGKSRKDARGASYTLQPKPLLRPAVLFPVAMAFITLSGFLRFCKTPSYLRPAADKGSASAQFDFDGFARLPINYEGRPMPMESVARDLLKLSAEQETFYVYDKPFDPEKPKAREKEKRPQVQLLLDFMTGKPERGSYEIFRITNQDLLGFMNLSEKQKRYSIEQIAQRGEELDNQIRQAGAKKEAKQELSQYEKDLLELAGDTSRFRRMGAWPELNVVPPLKPGEEWHSISAEAKTWSGAEGRAPDNPAARGFFNMLQAYASGDAATFNREVASYQQFLDQRQPEGTRWLDLEVFLRRLDPFHLAMWTYLLAFVLACASWAGWSVPLRRAAMAVLLVTLVFHSLGILSRVLITGRAPVVTLYTSAVVIGWFAILIAIPVEFITRRSIGTAVAAAIGCVTLIIARQLYWTEGDTMRELQAVLDTNFWLWTHVQSVTIGYAATLLAGLLAIVYIIAGVFTRGLDADTRKVLAKVTYGVVCFATLFSFVGTTLGGIWADQSWGRFWGWDPKENGAILIVAWNAIILHARWAGLIRERGIAVLAVIGGIVTGWSWFGTNELGVGLHSYGFMDGTVFWLGVSWAILLLLSGIGMLPTRYWRSSDGPGGSRPPARFEVLPAASKA